MDARGGWHVSLLVDNPNIGPLPQSGKSVGLDLGINSLIATSNGEKIANPKHFERHRKKLKRVQKALSRKQKGSRNRDKARVQVPRVQAKIADSRKDFLHKLTTQLVRENQTIAALGFGNQEHGEKRQTGKTDCGCKLGGIGTPTRIQSQVVWSNLGED
uniref:RNA-guided endonuclease InsQ/TnpB family protein n=1 Tax=Microseira wollei TaxID=467598 RepID=UPI0035A24EA1